MGQLACVRLLLQSAEATRLPYVPRELAPRSRLSPATGRSTWPIAATSPWCDRSPARRFYGIAKRIDTRHAATFLQRHFWIASVTHACSLHGQQDQQLLDDLIGRPNDTKAKYLRARDHLPE